MIHHLTPETLTFLENVALRLRVDSVRATTASKSGHPTSCLSAADIVCALFFHVMRMDIKNPKNQNNDRFILSKGHAIPVVYAAYKHLGVISDAELLKLRDFDSPLEGHPTPRFAYNEAATGSLGQGLSVAAGMALYAKKYHRTYRTYALVGDGECAEGSIWEAAEFCAKQKIDNIVGIVDCNRLAQTGPSIDNHKTDIYREKWHAFGWKTFVVDGHDIRTLVDTLQKAEAVRNQPVMIIAKTYKGYGLPELQDKNGFHGKPIAAEDLEKRIGELKLTFPSATYETATVFTPQQPEQNDSTEKTHTITLDLNSDSNAHLFDVSANMATRKAFGYALVALGKASQDVFALDADVGNSTFTQLFETEFPHRFVQNFIAEQNMISVATGLESRGALPFAATFAAFFTRAFDQIRMAGIGRNALRLVGSHSGVSIGEDGPSQMGLEDLAIMATVPHSIILYPSDAVSTYRLTELMANYHDGISYMRTTRASTPMIYRDQSFSIGGCHVLRSSSTDVACLVGAGITLHECLKAADQLAQENINVSVIDAYCVKPLDIATLVQTAQESNNILITVEDHYYHGGIGQTIAAATSNKTLEVYSLFVPDISRSGTPEKLMANAGIDAESVITKVKSLCAV